jgi:hypothetical protein
MCFSTSARLWARGWLGGRGLPAPVSVKTSAQSSHQWPAGSQAGKPYGQRPQAETVMSMMKRNLGDAMRAKSKGARQQEQLLRVLTHDLMIL